MTIEEVGAVMDVLTVAYPQFYAKSDQRERLNAAKLWAAMFAEDPVEIVMAAVKAFLVTDTKGFPPAIGMIKDRIYKLQNPDEMTELEAWGIVSRAISNSGYNAREEFDRLPAVLQACVGSPAMLHQWAMMDTDDVESVVASNFQRSFRGRSQSRREYELLPPEVKNIASEIAGRMKMPELPASHTWDKYKDG